MTSDQLRELSKLANLAADYMDDPHHLEFPCEPDFYKGRSLILYDCILGGKYGIVLTTSKKPEAWK